MFNQVLTAFQQTLTVVFFFFNIIHILYPSPMEVYNRTAFTLFSFTIVTVINFRTFSLPQKEIPHILAITANLIIPLSPRQALI